VHWRLGGESNREVVSFRSWVWASEAKLRGRAIGSVSLVLCESFVNPFVNPVASSLVSLVSPY
jgi:hypothetical protein